MKVTFLCHSTVVESATLHLKIDSLTPLPSTSCNFDQRINFDNILFAHENAVRWGEKVCTVGYAVGGLEPEIIVSRIDGSTA